MLFLALEQAQAWRLLHDPTYAGQLDAEGFLELCRRAGAGEEASQKAASMRALERMRHELPP